MKHQTDRERKSSEKAFHDRYFGGEPLRSSQEAIYDDRVNDMLLRAAFSELADVRGKRILYYGCGTNTSILLHLVQEGGVVVAMDISRVAAQAMRRTIGERGLDNNAAVLQMDGERLSFRDGSFDLVFGRAILHHLDTRRCGEELSRVLRPGGRAVFIEPLGNNPAINMYRRLTPSSRTPDEHPFVARDFRELRRNFPLLRQRPYFLFALFSLFLNAVFRNSALYRASFQLLTRWDDFLVRRAPVLGRYYWTTVITLEK